MKRFANTSNIKYAVGCTLKGINVPMAGTQWFGLFREIATRAWLRHTPCTQATLLVGRALMPDTIRTQVTVGHKCPTYGCYSDRGLRRTKQVGFPNPTNTETPVSPTVSV